MYMVYISRYIPMHTKHSFLAHIYTQLHIKYVHTNVCISITQILNVQMNRYGRCASVLNYDFDPQNKIWWRHHQKQIKHFTKFVTNYFFFKICEVFPQFNKNCSLSSDSYTKIFVLANRSFQRGGREGHRVVWARATQILTTCSKFYHPFFCMLFANIYTIC